MTHEVCLTWDYRRAIGAPIALPCGKRPMNKYEERARQQRTASLRSSMSLWTGGIALLIVLLLIIGFRNSLLQTNFFKLAAVTLAVLLLVLRQVSRRLRGKPPRAAQPDPKSTLKLN